MRPTAVLAAFAALAVPALGELAVSLPTADTTCAAGASCTVSWIDNNLGSTLAQLGTCTVALYTGSKNLQTFLQPIAYPNPINVSTVRTIDFTPDPTVGENGKYYFIRISSTTLKVGADPSLSFSAIFTLSGMTSTFNETVKNQIAAANSTTTTGTATVTATRTNTGTNTGTSTRSTSSSAASASVKAANGTGAALVNASPVTYTGVAAFIGAVVGLFY